MNCSIKCLFKDTAEQNDTVYTRWKMCASGKRIEACKFWKVREKNEHNNTI